MEELYRCFHYGLILSYDRILFSQENSKMCFPNRKSLVFPYQEKRYKIRLRSILLLAIMEEKNNNICMADGNSPKTGSPTLLDITNRTHRYNFRLSEYEDIKFKKLYEQSGAKTLTEFITNCILDKPLK